MHFGDSSCLASESKLACWGTYFCRRNQTLLGGNSTPLLLRSLVDSQLLPYSRSRKQFSPKRSARAARPLQATPASCPAKAASPPEGLISMRVFDINQRAQQDPAPQIFLREASTSGQRRQIPSPDPNSTPIALADRPRDYPAACSGFGYTARMPLSPGSNTMRIAFPSNSPSAMYLKGRQRRDSLPVIRRQGFLGFVTISSAHSGTFSSSMSSEKCFLNGSGITRPFYLSPGLIGKS